MSFAAVDPIIRAWAERHRLHLYTSYKDVDVRSIDVVGKSGKKTQIWLDPPDSSRRITVHIWDYSRRREDLAGSSDNLDGMLENALNLARGWTDAL